MENSFSDTNPSSASSLGRLENAYAEKRADYFECARPEMLELFPSKSRRVLDVGCGSGVFGETLRDRFGCEVWGVEPDSKSAGKASATLHRAIHGCFDERLELPANYFDCICFNDVLEHMADPAFALELARKLLAPDGKIIASIPNIAQFPILWRLAVRGRWDYTERGILDKTHLRFFTRNTIAELFERAGFAVEQLRGINEFTYMQPGDSRIWKIYRLVAWLPVQRIRDMRCLQFAVVAGKNSRPQT